MAASSKSDRLGSGKLILALLSAIIVVTQSLPFQDERRSNLDPTGDGSITKKNSCGIRSLGVPLNNATQASNFNVEYFRTQPESFPWIVKLVLDSLTIKNENENKDKLLLCTGVAVSSFVAIFPAHCVSGNEKSRLTNDHILSFIIVEDNSAICVMIEFTPMFGDGPMYDDM